MVAFHDWTVDCRTQGHGSVRKLSLAELKKLDAGYGYTPDGGKTHPLRGKGIGGIPTVEEVLREVPRMRLRRTGFSVVQLVWWLRILQPKREGSDFSSSAFQVSVFRRSHFLLLPRRSKSAKSLG